MMMAIDQHGENVNNMHEKKNLTVSLKVIRSKPEQEKKNIDYEIECWNFATATIMGECRENVGRMWRKL